MVHGSRIIRVPQKNSFKHFPSIWRGARMSGRKSNEANQNILACRGPKVGEWFNKFYRIAIEVLEFKTSRTLMYFSLPIIIFSSSAVRCRDDIQYSLLLQISGYWCTKY